MVKSLYEHFGETVRVRFVSFRFVSFTDLRHADFEQTDAIIWVVDSADVARLEICRLELSKLLTEEVCKQLLFLLSLSVRFQFVTTDAAEIGWRKSAHSGQQTRSERRTHGIVDWRTVVPRRDRHQSTLARRRLLGV